MGKSLRALWVITASLLFLTFFLAFFWVPPASEFERRYGNGHIAKIVFIHVPLALVSFLGFLAAAGFGIAYLRTRRAWWDALGLATIEVGWLYAILATVTGMWFSKLAWGEFWNWDPRQTTMFMLLLAYTAYLLVRGSVTERERCAAISAVYAILGAIAAVFLVFIIPYLPSVQRVSLHPSGIIARGGLDTPYRLVLALSLIAMGLFFLQLARLRAKIAYVEGKVYEVTTVG